jgi:hypothetical protein
MKRGSQQQGREEVTSLAAIGNGEEKAAKRKKKIKKGKTRKRRRRSKSASSRGQRVRLAAPTRWQRP